MSVYGNETHSEIFMTETSTGIAARDIVVRYERSREPVLENQSLDILPGKINVLIGPNGCGKSTLLKAMARQLRLASGTITIDKRDITTMSSLELASRVGILFQENIAPNDLTVQELIYYSRYAKLKLFESLKEADHAAVERAMEKTNTLRWRDRLIRELSSGQRQLVWIALLLAQESTYLFLDEPTTFLDMANQMEVLDCVSRLNRELGNTVVMSIHDLNMAILFADWIFVMKDGKVVSCGKPKDIITAELIQYAFGVDVRVVDNGDGQVYCIVKRKRQ